GVVRQGDALSASSRCPQALLGDRGPRRAAHGTREDDREALDAGPDAGRKSAGASLPPRPANRRPALADARSAPAPTPNPGRAEAAVAAGEPGAAAAGRLRRPPLD